MTYARAASIYVLLAHFTLAHTSSYCFMLLAALLMYSLCAALC